jgi:hypothetical protein
METLIQIPWSKAAKQRLKPAGGVNAIEKEVLAGKAQLWQTPDGSLLVVLRSEGELCVVVAVAGRQLLQASSTIINTARTVYGAAALRFHTKVPNLIRGTLEALPVKLVEVRRHLFSTEYVYVMGIV